MSDHNDDDVVATLTLKMRKIGPCSCGSPGCKGRVAVDVSAEGVGHQELMIALAVLADQIPTAKRSEHWSQSNIRPDGAVRRLAGRGVGMVAVVDMPPGFTPPGNTKKD